ncbi:uncharacterized protein LOC129256211 [Lytechinus pictus]|uniref:uncharacterized protein LOC129256211 n=1 Tax=Lytechinus pictus TaxID=7653 RepID=UPI0030B9FAAE
MMSITRQLIILVLCVLVVSVSTDAAECTSELSVEAGCDQCTDWGHCEQETVPVDPWLQYALKTQRELQIDATFDQFIMLDSHNSFQARAYGLRYGANDTCVWPPPYPENCTSIANHEFTIIDQLNLGIRGIEIDNWYCYGAMRVCHLGVHEYLGVCESDHMLFSDLISDIGQWLDQPENQDEIIRLYFNEKTDQGHDDEVNDIIQGAFGTRVLTPANLRDTYGGSWPTIRKMREDGKHVLIAAGGTDGFFTHGDVYIHPLYFDVDVRTNLYLPYPDCSGRNDTNIVRVYSDSLNFPLVEKGYYSGEDTVGSIKDLSEYVKCRIQYPAMDMINTNLVKTGVWTWAERQPNGELTYDSCVMLKGTDHRWYVSSNCSENHYYACQHDSDDEVWTVSDEAGPYSTEDNVCPQGYSFSIPHDGYRKQKLIESSLDEDVWLNFSPWLPSGPVEPTDEVMTTESAANRLISIPWVVLAVLCGVLLL